MSTNPTAEELFFKGLDCLDGNDFANAETYFVKTLELAKGRISALNNLAVAQYRQGKISEAALTASEVLAQDKRNLAAYSMLSNCQIEQGDYEAALETCQISISIDPTIAEPHCRIAHVLNLTGKYREALGFADRAIELDPQFTGAFLYRGNSLRDLHRFHEALDAYQKALSLRPDWAEVWLSRGNVLFLLDRHDEAMAAYDAALSAKPDLAEAWFSRATVLFFRTRFDEAFFAYDKAFSLSPDLVIAEGMRLYAKMQICNWDWIGSDCEHLIESVGNNKANAEPFAFLSINSTARDQYNYARLWTQKRYPPVDQPSWRGEHYQHGKLRIGYVSADFREHPVAPLVTGLFAGHDRSQFEVTGISIGPDDGSEIRRRLERSVDSFIDAAALDADALANRIREQEIDILIDLNGHTRNARTELFARRPAPIQVNYLGYPGTMGADYIDYIIADPILVPAAAQADYAEKIVYLPHSYMPHDAASRPISDRSFERADFGLPERGFVFCCFNNAYKLNPRLFRSRMNILKAVEGSVLWLSEP